MIQFTSIFSCGLPFYSVECLMMHKIFKFSPSPICLFPLVTCAFPDVPRNDCQVQCSNAICRDTVVSNSVPLWTISCQAPLSMGFFSQDYWDGLPFPSPSNTVVLKGVFCFF